MENYETLKENIGENLWYLECDEAFLLYVKQKTWSMEENYE